MAKLSIMQKIGGVIGTVLGTTLEWVSGIRKGKRGNKSSDDSEF